MTAAEDLQRGLKVAAGGAFIALIITPLFTIISLRCLQVHH